LNKIKVFIEEMNKGPEELGDERWLSDLSFLCRCDRRLVCSFNRELQGREKIITEMFDSINAFKGPSFLLWEDQLKVHNIHFLHQKSLETIIAGNVQECLSIFLLQEELE
jgi:hypothetical protein